MATHRLMTGGVLDLSGLSKSERDFLAALKAAVKGGVDYPELLRRVRGPGAQLLRGGRLTAAVMVTPAYRAAQDIADRVGVEQGYLLAPDVPTADLDSGGDLLSLTEAADLIGITRPAAHQALMEGRLRGRRVGNAWILRRRDVEQFKKTRSGRNAAAPARPHVPARVAARGAHR